MSANRGRQARHLAKLLTERTHTKVTLDYRDSVQHSGRAWHIVWTDGPTWRQMHTLAAGLADEVPALDVARMRTSRSHTARGEAVSVLLWLDADQANAKCWPGVWPEFALDLVTYPERVASLWQRRAQALLSLTAGYIDTAACTALDARMAAHGWDGALAWLDEIADGERRLKAVG